MLSQNPPHNATNPTAEYTIDFSAIAANPKLAEFAKSLAAVRGFGSQAGFNSTCREIIRCWEAAFPQGLGGDTREFEEHLDEIESGTEKIIRTGWGGVHIIQHDHPHVEKFLVIKQGGYLAFEKHAAKEEQIEVKEGAGVLLYREQPGVGPVKALALLPGVKVSFRPGQEHCVIGTEDLLIFEVSEDHKGMDQDLIFIYTPES
jgi:hypothetical protein